jgi:hypothetical protein
MLLDFHWDYTLLQCLLSRAYWKRIKQKRGFDMRFGRIFTACLLLLPYVATGDAIPADAPVPAKVFVRQNNKPPEGIDGTLTSWDDQSLTIKTKTGERKLNWTDLTGVSAYQLRFRVMDRKDPGAWLSIGTLAWGLGDKSDGRNALSQAQRMDPKLADDVDAVLASTAGILTDPPMPTELLQDESAIPQGHGQGLLTKYLKSTPAQAKTAMAETRADASKVGKAMKIEFHELETEHFLIFTDWGPESDQFLKDNLEAAYKVVSKQFEIPADENVFAGKLGVFMFNSHGDFLKSGQRFDKIPNGAKGNNIVGYFASAGEVVAHLATSKPDAPKGVSGDAVRTEWAYVLTHEFTHAFVSRYRSPLHIPTWINEGIAEVVASQQFPRDVMPQARKMAHNPAVARLFEEKAGIQGADMYPVMRTLTEVLLLKDRQSFLKMFDELKTGASGAKALKDNYGWTSDDLQTYWRKYLGV